jgi:hypothetical protein
MAMGLVEEEEFTEKDRRGSCASKVTDFHV